MGHCCKNPVPPVDDTVLGNENSIGNPHSYHIRFGKSRLKSLNSTANLLKSANTNYGIEGYPYPVVWQASSCALTKKKGDWSNYYQKAMRFVKMITKIKTKGQYFQVNLKPNRLLFYLLTKLDTRLGTKTLKKNIFFHLHHSSFFIFMFCSFAKSLSQEILWLFQIALLNFANFWPHKI